MLNNSTSYWKDTFNELNICECGDNEQNIDSNVINNKNNNFGNKIEDNKFIENVFVDKRTKDNKNENFWNRENKGKFFLRLNKIK